MGVILNCLVGFWGSKLSQVLSCFISCFPSLFSAGFSLSQALNVDRPGASLCLLCIDNLIQSSAFTFQSPADGLRSSPEFQMHGNSLLNISTRSLIEVSNLACSKCSSCFKPTTPVPFPVFLTSLSNSSIYPVASTQKPSSQLWLLSFSYLSYSVQFSSVAQSCPTLCDPMECSTPGLPVHH